MLPILEPFASTETMVLKIYNQPKIRTKAFKKVVRRQAMKLKNKNEWIMSSNVKITGNLPGC